MIDKIKIGAFDYKVTLLPEIEDDTYWGLALYGDLEIQISEKETEAIRPQTLLHEVIHIIMQQAGFREHNEAVIEAMSYGLIAVMRDNPDFVKLLQGEDAINLVKFIEFTNTISNIKSNLQ